MRALLCLGAPILLLAVVLPGDAQAMDCIGEACEALPACEFSVRSCDVLDFQKLVEDPWGTLVGCLPPILPIP